MSENPQVVPLSATDDAAGETPPRPDTPPTPSRPPRTRRGRARRDTPAGAGATAPPKPASRRTTDDKVRESLTGTYQMLGGTLASIGMVKQDSGLAGTGVAFINSAETLTDAWMDLAEQNPAVKAALRRFTEGSSLGTLIVAHGACMVPLLASRGVIPDAMSGVMTAMSGASSADTSGVTPGPFTPTTNGTGGRTS